MHSATGVSPYEAVYGLPPPRLLSYVKRHHTCGCCGGAPEKQGVNCSNIKHLEAAQRRMIWLADRHRKERSFGEGDWVFLRLQPYRQNSVIMRRNLKLSPRFYDPYKVLQKIGQVAYKLQLPPD